MSVSFVLPGPLRDLTGGRGMLTLDCEADTVFEALQALRATHPAVYDRIITEQREVRQHVNVFVGPQDIRWAGGLDTPLPANAEVIILPALSGG